MNGLRDNANTKGVLAWFASHPTAANLFMLLLMVLGLITVGNVKRESFPEFSSSEVRIAASYPGASAEDVENAVCRRIEEALESVNDLEELVSEAREGSASITAVMRDGGDLSRFLDDIKTQVEAISDLPDGLDTPVVSELNRMNMVCAVAVTGPMTVTHLQDYCEEIKEEIQALDKVSQVVVSGFSDRQFRVEIESERLMQLGLTIQDVADAIAAQSLDLPAGSLATSERNILVRFSDERDSAQELEDLVVTAGDAGAELRLGDIAVITDTFEDDESGYYINGQRAGMLTINMAKSEDALEVMDTVQAYLDRVQAQAPPGVEFTMTQNRSQGIRDRLSLLTVNGLQGLVLVFLAMWLFFSLRLSFWVAMGLPVSFLATFFAMNLLGLSLNMLSMTGLLLALGLLMDDAIVISENVALHLSRGKSALRAAVDGTAEVAGGVFSSFLTTVFIFGAISLFIQGNIGKVLWVMPVVLILTLSVSLVEAFCILPNHLAHSLARVNHNKPSRFRERIDASMEFVRERIVGRMADWAIAWRYLFIGLVIALFLASLALVAGGAVKQIAFPEVDGDVLSARILLPQGTPLTRTREVAEQAAAALEQVNAAFKERQPLGDDGEHMDLVQHASIQYGVNEDAGESGPHLATVTADLLGAELRNASLDEVAAVWRDAIGVVPDAISLTVKESMAGPGGMAINIRLTGKDLDDLKAASTELQEYLATFDGVVDLADDLRPGKPEVRVSPLPGALAFGMTSSSVARQLRAAFQGVTATQIQVGRQTYDVAVSLADADQDSLADLEYFYLLSPDGKDSIPLTAVADLEEDRGYASISRINGRRSVTVKGSVDTRIANTNEIITSTMAEFMPELLRSHPDVSVQLRGQAAEGSETGTSLMTGLAIGVFGVFILLSLQFKSYLEPFVVISIIPLALVGVIWGHWLMGLDLSTQSLMGFVSLAGVVVNDSILLVLYIKERRQAGESIQEAAAQGSRRRFRPVLLTSLTTIVGLAPLLAERSLQAQILIPMAASLVFGLMATTLLVLFTVPALYTILDDFGFTRISGAKH